MADNYLERKMEDYRSGKRCNYSPRLTPAGRRPGWLCIPFEPRTILISGPDCELLHKLTGSLCDAGCRVALMCSPARQGTFIAQSHGALYIPGSPDSNTDTVSALRLLTNRWGDVNTLILIDNDSVIGQLNDCQTLPPVRISISCRADDSDDVTHVAVDPYQEVGRAFNQTIAALLGPGEVSV